MTRLNTRLNQVIDTVRANMHRVATLGGWSRDPEWALLGRIPNDDRLSAGFDAAIACCLDLIPRDMQTLSARLHGNYSPEDVLKIRTESDLLRLDRETTWWLAASYLCKEGKVTVDTFLQQILDFERMLDEPGRLVAVAHLELQRMKRSFVVIDGVPFVTADGGLQGAYLEGHTWGVESTPYGFWFISTYMPSLGLENFNFSDRVDEDNRPISGLNSPQRAKASSFAELAAVVNEVKHHLTRPFSRF